MKPPHGRGPGNRNDGGSHRPGGAPTGGWRGSDRPQNSRGQGDRPQGPRPANPGAPARDDGRLHLAARPAQQPAGPRHQGPPPRHDRPRGQPDAPRGTVWLYGIHAVAAALANPARRLRHLLLTEEAEAAVAARQKLPWPIQAERTERARLDQLLGRDVVHQGAALLADLLTPPALATALERPGPILVLDQVTDPRNVGAILRSAAAFGAAAVITQDRNAPEETGALAKVASGALEKVPLFRAVNIARTIVALKAAGVWCVGLDAAGPDLSAAAIGPRRVALVLGAEGEGLRRLTRETCDEVAGLAMPKGHASAMESLNVAAAAAIALYEVSRIR